MPAGILVCCGHSPNACVGSPKKLMPRKLQMLLSLVIQRWRLIFGGNARRHQPRSVVSVPCEVLGLRQMLAADLMVAVDLHNHYFAHWREAAAKTTDTRVDFTKTLGSASPKGRALIEQNLGIVESQFPTVVVAGQDAPRYMGSTEHLGFEGYTSDERKGALELYYENVAALDEINEKSLANPASGNDLSAFAQFGGSGVELTPKSDDESGHIGLPFIDLYKPDIAAEISKRTEFGFEILNTGAFRNELKIINHPMSDKVDMSILGNANNTSILKMRKFVRQTWTPDIARSKGSVVAMEFPKRPLDEPVKPEQESEDVKQYRKKINRAEQFYVGMLSDGYYLSPSFGSDTHSLKGNVSTLVPFKKGSVTLAFVNPLTNDNTVREDDVEDAFRRRDISIVRQLTDLGKSPIAVSSLRLRASGNKALIDFAAPPLLSESDFIVQLVSAKQSGIQLTRKLPNPVNWLPADDGTTKDFDDGTYTVRKIPVSNGHAEVPLVEGFDFAYVRVIYKSASGTYELAGLTSPIVASSRPPIGKKLSLRTNPPPVTISIADATRIPLTELLAENLENDYEWDLQSSDPAVINAELDDNSIVLTPISEGSVTLTVMATDGDEDHAVTFTVTANGDAIRQLEADARQRSALLAVNQQRLAKTLGGTASDFSGSVKRVSAIDLDATKVADSISTMRRKLTDAEADKSAADDTRREAERSLENATAVVNTAEKSVDSRKAEYGQIDSQTKAAYNTYDNLVNRTKAAWSAYQDAPKSKKDQAKARWESLRNQKDAAETAWRQLQQKRDAAAKLLADARAARDSAVAVRDKAKNAVDRAIKNQSEKATAVSNIRKDLSKLESSVTPLLDRITDEEKIQNGVIDAGKSVSSKLDEFDEELRWLYEAAAKLKSKRWVRGIDPDRFVRESLTPRQDFQKQLRWDLRELQNSVVEELRRLQRIRSLFS